MQHVPRDGRLVISTHDPFMDHALARGTDYFATYDFSEEWSKGGQTVTPQFIFAARAG